MTRPSPALDGRVPARSGRRAAAFAMACACSLGAVYASTAGADADSSTWNVPNWTKTTSGARILNIGHVDVASLVEDDSLVTRIKDTSDEGVSNATSQGASWHEPSDIVLQVLPAARTQVPDDPAYSFLGEPGTTLWRLPETQRDDVLWPGWSTESIRAGEAPSGVRWSLEKVEGPGSFSLYTSSATELGAVDVRLSSRDGVDDADSFVIGRGVHAHGTWAFDREGSYCLTFDRTATLASGRTVSDPFTLAVAVGEVDVRAIDPTQCSGDAAPTPTPTQTLTPTPTATPTPTPAPSPTPTPTPTPTMAPTNPGAVWKVTNGHTNARGSIVLNDGHVDVASLIEGGKLVTRIKDTTLAGQEHWRDIASTVLQLLPASATKVPSSPAYSFLGKPGATFYQATQTQRDGLLWPGWSTEAIPLNATRGGVSWALTQFSGPGTFALYDSDSFGQPQILMNSADGVSTSDAFTIPRNTHAHGAWAFSAPGQYCLRMARTTSLADGTTSSDSFVLPIAVGTADVQNFSSAACFTSTRGGSTGGNTGNASPIAPPAPPADDASDDATTGGGTGNGAAAAATASANACVPKVTVLSSGHLDYASVVRDGSLQSLIGDDSSGTKVFREPAGTVAWLKPGSRLQLPSGLEQIGAAGSAVWMVPQTQSRSLIWLGWSTEALSPSQVSSPVTWTLNSVEGPGTVKVYQSASFGGVQELVFNDGGSKQIPLGVHAHANWAFSKEGFYRLRMTQSVTLASGKKSSDTETLTIAVGNVDPAQALAGTGDCKAASAAIPAAEVAPSAGAARAAVQAEAPAAQDAAARLAAATPVAAGTGEQAQQQAATAQTMPVSRTVPTLLSVLGGLFTVGAMGSGVAWGRGMSPGAKK